MQSAETITIVGPAGPADIHDLFSGQDSIRASGIEGYRGMPVTDLVRALVQSGSNVEVVSSAEQVDERVEFLGPQLRMLVVPARPRARHRALDFFRQERALLARAIRDTDGSIVHAHWTYEFAWAAQTVGRPLVVTAQDAPLSILLHYRDTYRAIRTAMAYLVRLRLKNLVVVSPHLAARWQHQMLYRGPMRVVPNIAPHAAASAHRPALNRDDGDPMVLDISDASDLKNARALIAAVRLLRREGRAIRLHLAGNGLGPSGAFARSAATEGVVFLGLLGRDEVFDQLSRASVFVHASLEEGCSVAVAEAMGAGVPVVAGEESGGVPWQLDEGRSGVLVDVRNPAEIAAGIRRVLDSPSDSNQLVAAAQERAASLFSPQAVANAYRVAYSDAVAASDTRRRLAMGSA